LSITLEVKALMDLETLGYGELFYSKFVIKVHTKAVAFLNLHPDWLHCDEFRPNIVLVYKNKLG